MIDVKEGFRDREKELRVLLEGKTPQIEVFLFLLAFVE